MNPADRMKQRKKIYAGIIFLECLLAIFLFFAMCEPLDFTDDLDITAAIIFIILILLGLGTAIWATIQDYHAPERKYVEKLMAFYNACQSQTLTDIEDPIIKQKLLLLAESMSIQTDDGVALFLEAESFIAVQKAAQEEARVAEEREELLKKEMAEIQEYSRYIGCHGREKRIKMLTDEKDALEQRGSKLSDVLALQSAYVDGLSEKESDWALIGGLVSGIAGTGAGVAAAINEQAKNAEIRAKNEKIRKSTASMFTPLYMEAVSSDQSRQFNLDNARKNLQAAQLKLVFDIPAQELMNYLHFSHTKVEFTQTGACRVTTKVRLAKPLPKIRDAATVIDGVIYAMIIQNGITVDTVDLVLHTWGVFSDSYEETLTGLCYGVNKQLACSVKFFPCDIWLMER